METTTLNKSILIYKKSTRKALISPKIKLRTYCFLYSGRHYIEETEEIGGEVKNNPKLQN